MKIYVGNLSYDVTEAEIAAEFSRYGNVESTVIPYDKTSGRPKGFAFVEMASKSEANAAITGLNGKMLNERTLIINEARPRDNNNRNSGFYSSMSSGGFGRGGHSGGKKRRF